MFLTIVMRVGYQILVCVTFQPSRIVVSTLQDNGRMGTSRTIDGRNVASGIQGLFVEVRTAAISAARLALDNALLRYSAPAGGVVVSTLKAQDLVGTSGVLCVTCLVMT